jgi:anti-sigma factor RsiW
MLPCHECEKYLDAFLDKELGVEESRDVQEHMAACMVCADRLESERIFRAFVRQHLTVVPLPDEMKRRIIRQAVPTLQPQSRWRRLRASVHLWDFAMGMATAALVLLFVFGAPFMRTFEREDMTQKFVHEASMAYQVYKKQYMPLEVQGANDTVVVQWFNHRMGDSLKVPCITDEATQLIGGRLCRLLDRQSAALMYRRKGADIFVFAFHGGNFSLPAKHLVRTKAGKFYVQSVEGRPVALWQWGGITYSMVGDLSRDDLLQVANTINYR